MMYHLRFSFFSRADQGLYIHDIYQTDSGEAGLHDQDFHEFTFVMKGNGIHHINRAKQVIRPGCLIFLRPGDMHTMELTGSPPLYMWNVVIDPKLWKSLESRLLSPEQIRALHRPKESPLAQLSPEKLRWLEESVIRLSKAPFKRLLFTRILSDVLLAILEPDALTFLSHLPAGLRRSLDCLSEPDSLKEGVPAMTRAANCSREHLSRELKRLTGKTPTDWLLEKRLARACELLLTSDAKIIDVAYDAGFNHLGYFTRTFHRLKGLPPRKWREQKRMDPRFTA